MRLPTIFLSLSLASAYLARPSASDSEQLSFTSSNNKEDDGKVSTLACPTWTVRCVKEGKWPSGIVGDIGKKPFCFSGFRCNQCEYEENTIECNETFPDECEDLCQAFAPIPF